MGRKEIIIGLLAAIAVALMLSPFASPWPDGLEKVAGDKGFLEKGEVQPAIVSPVPDYTWPGIKSEKIATSAAGVMGTITVFVLVYILSSFLKKRDAE
jgi:cobalt/nickel transport protein